MDTPPDALVLSIIEPKQFVSPSTGYGKRMESIALVKYKAYKNDRSITVCSAGFVIYKEKPYFGYYSQVQGQLEESGVIL